jgi:ATP-binding cassette subfamily B (MDR/TAP) protein 1
MQFYLPTSGEILIDRNPMKELDVSWIRNNITLLEQKSVLFNESVLTNITFGRQNHETLTMKDIRECIQLTMLENTIDSLPMGIKTCVGPGGSFLSGGQRQRVAIARAKLRDTPILIMDEPTSALDSTNRVAVMKAVRQWRNGKTTIIITHDMSQIMERDYLYILEQGSIVESGYKYAVEHSLCGKKYFHTEVDETAIQMGTGTSDGVDTKWENSSRDSLYALQPPMPVRGHHQARTSWAQGTIPSSVRFSTLGITPNRRSIYQIHPGEPTNLPFPDLSSRLSFVNVNEASRKSPKETAIGLPAEEFEMVPIEDRGSLSTTIPNRHVPSDPKANGRPHYRHSLKFKTRRTPKDKMTPLSQIMRTIYPNLTPRYRIILFLGLGAALVHASATPIFSYCLSQLFSTFYAGTNNVQLTMTWSLAVLGVSFGDGLASFFMHYFLEICGEAWMDTFRKNAFERILDQPQAWFEKNGNGSLRLTSALDQNGEDMRNLLGRFGGYVVVAVSITLMSIVWSLIVCWKLTLVALACGPVIYTITRGFEGTNGLWERRCNGANSDATDVFTETFLEIRTVRTLTLEGHFHRKHDTANGRCLMLGLKRAMYTGMIFGMVESTVVFASGKYSCNLNTANHSDFGGQL